MSDTIQPEQEIEPSEEPKKMESRFLLRPIRDSEGKLWEHGSDFSKIWDWGYSIEGGPPDTRQYELAIKISDAADTIREFGRPSSNQHKAKEGAAAQEIMTDLSHQFSAVLVQNQMADLDRSIAQVEKHKSDFFRRVVTPRHRRNLRGPVLMTIFAMIFALAVGFLAPVVGVEAAKATHDSGQTDISQAASPKQETDHPVGNQIAVPPGNPAQEKQQTTAGEVTTEIGEAEQSQPSMRVQLQALCFVIAGTLMGRLLFFAMSHSEKIGNVDEYFQYESVSGEAATLSLVFDIIVGISAFVAFQTGLIIISIGADSGSEFQGISTLQIDDNGLVAYGFGILVGISRTAFLSRVRAISQSNLGSGGSA